MRLKNNNPPPMLIYTCTQYHYVHGRIRTDQYHVDRPLSPGTVLMNTNVLSFVYKHWCSGLSHNTTYKTAHGVSQAYGQPPSKPPEKQ